MLIDSCSPPLQLLGSTIYSVKSQNLLPRKLQRATALKAYTVYDADSGFGIMVS